MLVESRISGERDLLSFRIVTIECVSCGHSDEHEPVRLEDETRLRCRRCDQVWSPIAATSQVASRALAPVLAFDDPKLGRRAAVGAGGSDGEDDIEHWLSAVEARFAERTPQGVEEDAEPATQPSRPAGPRTDSLEQWFAVVEEEEAEDRIAVARSGEYRRAAVDEELSHQVDELSAWFEDAPGTEAPLPGVEESGPLVVEEPVAVEASVSSIAEESTPPPAIAEPVPVVAEPPRVVMEPALVFAESTPSSALERAAQALATFDTDLDRAAAALESSNDAFVRVVRRWYPLAS